MAEFDLIINYYESLVSTIHPNINSYLKTSKNPCSLEYEDISDEDQAENILNLINTVQMHLKCTSTCFKTKMSSKCRFDFPKELQEKSKLELDSKNNYEYISKRNHPLINNYNKFMLQHFRSNMDIKPIVSLYALNKYLAKYSSKGEIKSNAYKSLINDISLIKQDNSVKDPAKKLITKVLMKSISHRDISAQETVHLIVGYELVKCSRSFVRINLRNETWVKLFKNENLCDLEDSKDSTNKIEIYCKRDIEFEEFPFLDFYKKTSEYKKKEK